MSFSKGTTVKSFDTESAGDIDRSMSSTKHGGSMANSVLRFNDVSFEVGKGDKKRNLLENINGKVKWGRKFYLTKCITLTIPLNFDPHVSPLL
jgi:hypothetical protein